MTTFIIVIILFAILFIFAAFRTYEVFYKTPPMLLLKALGAAYVSIFQNKTAN